MDIRYPWLILKSSYPATALHLGSRWGSCVLVGRVGPDTVRQY